LLVNPDLSLSGAIHLHIICRVPLGDWFLLFVRLLAFVIGFILRQMVTKMHQLGFGLPPIVL